MIELGEEITVRGDDFIERRILMGPDPENLVAEREAIRISDRNQYWNSGFRAGLVAAVMLALVIVAFVAVLR